MDILILLASIFILLLVAVIVVFYLEKKEKNNFWSSLDMSLFLVMMPKQESKKEGDQKEEKVLIAQMEQIFTSFLYAQDKKFKGAPRIAFEVASQIGGTDISFYVAVPNFLATALEKYIHGIYTGALVEKVPQDYTIFEPGGVAAVSYMQLSESPVFPINTYQNLEKDPIATVANTLNKISANEGAAVQVVITPMDQGKWRKRIQKILEKMQEGKSAKAAIADVETSPIIKSINKGMHEMKRTPPNERTIEEDPKKQGVIDQMGMEAIQKKVQKQVFETNIRLIASAQTPERAEEILSHLEGSFGQFSLSSINSLEAVRPSRKDVRNFIYDFSFRNFNKKQSNILNIEELTSVYHFPTFFVETPYIKSVKSRVAAPPADLPAEGVVAVGKINYHGEEKKVYFASKKDRARHFYVIGQTGTGKSALLEEMIRQDILNGEGVGVIDPHGELVEHTLEIIPKERIEDVVIFEPSDMEMPMGLNMLEFETPEQKDFAVQEMIAIFYKLFPPEIIGPMFEHYMRNAMLALMADIKNPGTLVEIPRMFTDDQYMNEKLKNITDPIVRSFWLKEWKQTTGSTRSDMLGYVVSKVGRFIENEMMRNIIGQSHSGFDLSKIMDEKKIFLANLSKGMTGEVNSSLLGLILVSKMQMAAMRRARIAEEQRKDFYLYIDEFQNFTTDSIATILSEARKYKLCLTIAHQYIPQLEEEIRDAVLGNVGTIGAFRIGAEDAEFLEKQFEPEFSRFDLVNLDNRNLITKMMINGKISTPFKMQTIDLVKGNKDIVAPIKELAKLKYGRPKAEVEAEIMERSALGPVAEPLRPPPPAL